MAHVRERRIGAVSLERLKPILGEDTYARGLDAAGRMSALLARRVVWNVNSTAVGGGVAEMLPSLLGYTRGLGIDTRWMVIQGDDDFFHVTKRLHHALHGAAGDGSALGAEARRAYEATLEPAALELQELVQPGDFVILHDPQVAGLAPRLAACGVHLVWRCHIGSDETGPETERGWSFLAPYLEAVPHYVFSRRVYVPDLCDHGKSTIITPSIDPLSAKNEDLPEATVRGILAHTGLVEGPADGDLTFTREDGSPARVERSADVIRHGSPPTFDAPLVVQVSRWDPLKDMVGVMDGFARLSPAEGPAPELVLAGPNVKAVADDPEGATVFDDVLARWRGLPAAVRDRVHLASLPTHDVEENAAIVNALQRHAAVVVQKSLREGFGLTVTEAMWKGRPVLASAVGGIQDQIEDGVSGVLLEDPRDPDAFAAALAGILEDPARARALGDAARERVRERFLGLGHLVKWGTLVRRILDEAGPDA